MNPFAIDLTDMKEGTGELDDISEEFDIDSERERSPRPLTKSQMKMSEDDKELYTKLKHYYERLRYCIMDIITGKDRKK